ncbi:MAG: Phenylalanine--tRNA ligase alpha subunit [Microgenomates group bacterium ADurb.Bin219]|nr:MAG: Phenylalanine--tRNA ligase alpha subunit [Microgenomates group bacterium ADurb.Bin219]
MAEKIINLKNEAIGNILEAKDEKELERLKILYLGRSGKINQLTKEFPHFSPEEKIKAGRQLNETKKAIEEALENQLSAVSNQLSAKEEWFDVTEPSIKPKIGHLHLLTEAIREISSVFEKIGFVRVRYPEVEWDWYAFEGLNMPSTHPARDDFESFFVDTPAHPKLGRMTLTPHTSNGQLREMERIKPPIRMINIARCHRPNWDITHTPTFHQFEGLVIDKGINISHLKGIFDYFAVNFFGKDRRTRLRPFHFQFTEPSFEVDINCPLCLGKGCRTCKSGWMELGGSGMVHPRVLENGGLDPNIYSGFAFGWGVERTYIMRSGLKLGDIRPLYESDLRFINQF